MEIASIHFKERLKERFGLSDCPEASQQEIVNRIKTARFSRSFKQGNKYRNVYVYDLFTEGILKSLLPNISDRVWVVYDWENETLVTILDSDMPVKLRSGDGFVTR